MGSHSFSYFRPEPCQWALLLAEPVAAEGIAPVPALVLFRVPFIRLVGVREVGNDEHRQDPAIAAKADRLFDDLDGGGSAFEPLAQQHRRLVGLAAAHSVRRERVPAAAADAGLGGASR